MDLTGVSLLVVLVAGSSAMPSLAAKSASAWSASAFCSASFNCTPDMSMESRATRALPAALVRSSSTMVCRRSSVSPDPPMLLIIPAALSVNSAVALFILPLPNAALKGFVLRPPTPDRHIASLQQILVSRLGLLQLLAVLFQFARDGLQPERILAGGAAVARAQIGRSLGAQITL